MLRSLEKHTLLSSANSTGAGSAFNVERSKSNTICIVASSVTSGATVDIEAYIGSDWRVIHSESVTADGDYLVRDDHGHYEKIRAKISAHTDGSYDVFYTGSTEGL